MPNSAPPLPMECHPWYADKPWVRQWVAGKAPGFQKHALRIPVIPVLRASSILNDQDDEPSLKVLTMTRDKVVGLAPYVGRPFVYMWWVGTDDYGRQVSSEAEIRYVGDNSGFL